MQNIKLDNTYTIVCNWVNTRNGFRHEATLFKGRYGIAFARANYLNRTWEEYEYQTVIHNCLEEYFKGVELEKYKNLANPYKEVVQ